MGQDAKKHQKKLEKRHAKRKQKQTTVKRASQRTLADQLMAASRAPILECGCMAEIWDSGIGHVWISRQLSNGSIAFAVFLVDVFCLGVKDAFAEVVSRFSYNDGHIQKMKRDFPSRSLTPAATRKLVEGAVAYARALGIDPHPDYHEAALLFGAIDAKECPEEFTFGNEGQPYFVPGPYDSDARCQEIMHRLLQAVGPSGFRFVKVIEGPFGEDAFDEGELDEGDPDHPFDASERPLRMLKQDESGDYVARDGEGE
jgi:hypothetical protein